jgi:uncharacterized protein (DUF1684 family)
MNTIADQTYTDEILAWRQTKEDNLRREDGWLTLAGLFWIQEGENTVGSDPASSIALPVGAPEHLGMIDFHDNMATLKTNEAVLMDGQPVTSAVLRDDHAESGPSLVTVGTITFFVIQRSDAYAVRVRDTNSPERQAFTGRKWFDIDPTYRVKATFVAHTPARTVTVISSVGMPTNMDNPGYVEFDLRGQHLRLEAFASDEGSDELWFIIKDATSGVSTYGAARFMYAPFADGVVDLDFNKAYSPPCAFTKYATCPLPPKENHIPLAIEAGEKY